MYTTVFDKGNTTMTRTFPNGINVIVKFKEYKINCAKGGKTYEAIDFRENPFSLSDMDGLLIRASIADELLTPVGQLTVGEFSDIMQSLMDASRN